MHMCEINPILISNLNGRDYRTLTHTSKFGAYRSNIKLNPLIFMVEVMGLKPTTPWVQIKCSIIELYPHGGSK